MKPAPFKEQTVVLQKPSNMTDEECSPLPIYRDGTHCISKWSLSWRERLKVLFQGHVWLWVVSGNTHPPVAIEVSHPFEVKK